MRFEFQGASAVNCDTQFTSMSDRRARDEISREAYERGRQDALEEREQDFKASIDALISAAHGLRQEAQEIESRAMARAAEFIARVVVEAAPAIAIVAARQAILSVIEKRASIVDGGAVCVRANAELLAAIRERIADEADQACLRFEPDDTLGSACIAAHWRDGSVTCDIEDAASGIVRFIELAKPEQKGKPDDQSDGL